MKKFFAIVLLMVASAFAAAPTGAAVDGVYDYTIDTLISEVNGFDTLATTADSSTIVSKWKPDRGDGKAWEYVLVRGRNTGTSADSAQIMIRVDCLTKNDSLLYSIWPDSTTDAPAGEAILLPIAQTCFGEKFTIKCLAYNNGSALQLIINELAIYKRRPLTLMIRP